MTTGNDFRDDRQTVVSNGSNIRYGSFWSKSWNGADALPMPKNPAKAEPKWIVSYESVVGRNGKQRSKKVRTLNPNRSIWTRPPKRGRSKGEHAYTMSLRSYYDPICSFRYWNGNRTGPDATVWQSSFLGLAGSCSFVTKWSTNDDLALLSKLRESVSGGTFNAAVSLAEGSQSLQMILSAAKALDGAYRHAKRGNFKAAAKSVVDYERGRGRSGRVAKTIGKGWLANQYGVKPLLNDVREAAQTLAHLTSVPVQRTYTVSRKIEGVVKTNAPTAYAVTGEGYEAVKIKAIVREVNVISLVGLSDPASVAWEKLPYSFVVDWFVPIGAFLSARGLSQSVTGTFVTTRTVRYSAHNGSCIANPSSFYDFSGGANFRWRDVSVNRTISSSLFVPMPSIKPLGKSASWSHATSAVALLLQRHTLPSHGP